MARHQLTGGGGIAFQRSGVGDWVALLSKGFTQRHHQSTHFSFFRGPSVFFFHYPRLSGTQRQKCKGGGGIAFQRSGVGDWVALLSKGFTQRHHQSTHFSVFFFEGAIESPPPCTEANTRGEKGCGDRPNTNSLSALSGELSLTG